jgi:actin-like protein 6A
MSQLLILFQSCAFLPRTSLHRIAEMMFEKFSAPAMFLSKDAVLECYACGRTTGLTVDVGANGTVITPVLDGYVEAKGINRSVVGGRLADTMALSIIRKYASQCNSTTASLPHFRVIKYVGHDKSLLAKASGVQNVHPKYDALMHLEMGRDLKESVCRMAESPFVDTDPRFANLPLTPYELPDGTIIDMGLERFQMTEMLFDPSHLELDCAEMASLGYTPLNANSRDQGSGHPSASNEGLARLVSNSVLRCDPEVQTNLLSNIVVAGGGSAVEGLPERVKLDVETLVHGIAPGLRIKSIALAASERALTAWLGGSILASLGSFHEMWLSKQEYDEFGAGIVDKKCP